MALKKDAYLQRRKGNNTYFRTYEDSPNFYLNCGVFAVSQKKVFGIKTNFPTAEKYLPLTNIQIVNSSNIDILFYPNQRTAGFVIPASTSQIFDRRSLGGGLNSFAFYNPSTSVTIADKELEVNIWREGIVMEEAFRKMHKAFFNFLYKH